MRCLGRFKVFSFASTHRQRGLVWVWSDGCRTQNMERSEVTYKVLWPKYGKCSNGCRKQGAQSPESQRPNSTMRRRSSSWIVPASRSTSDSIYGRHSSRSDMTHRTALTA